ncbi:type Z 30S ribosomal protein S14 [Candidatus Peregrinibacteria bacterium CG_4_9_14_0_2_um_filter_53_11]|nr:MAG: type Z 30S ribosomal protein S14 [Candidatus Peregrinibacteria bacterium CG_4_9_14_0_2_um_filter_53_11]
MARKAIIVSQQRKKNSVITAIANGKKPKFPTRAYNRCRVCGKVGSYLRKFEMCRICVRENASNGLMPGVRKSSW